MKTDPDLHDRFERAGNQVSVDGQRTLDEIREVGERRRRSRRIQALAVAAVVGLLGVWVTYQLSFSDDRPKVPSAQPGPSGQIAYLTAYEESRDLLVLDAASGERGALHDGTGAVLWGAWSPGGSRIAYIVEEPRPGYEIVVADADGGDPVTIVEQDDTGAVGPDLLNLAWSPDGSRIAYSGRTFRRGVANRTIFIVNADGSGRATVLDGHWEWVSWAPDGQRLLLSGFPESETETAQFDLYTAGLDGEELVQLTDDAAIEHSPSWSPDGSRIVFSEGGDYDQDVYVMNADGSDVRRLTERDGFDFVPLWSPDGAWIAFASDRGATLTQQAPNRTGEGTTEMAIYGMRPDGSDVRLIVEVDGALLYPTSWTG